MAKKKGASPKAKKSEHVAAAPPTEASKGAEAAPVGSNRPSLRQVDTAPSPRVSVGSLNANAVLSRLPSDVSLPRSRAPSKTGSEHGITSRKPSKSFCDASPSPVASPVGSEHTLQVDASALQQLGDIGIERKLSHLSVGQASADRTPRGDPRESWEDGQAANDAFAWSSQHSSVFHDAADEGDVPKLGPSEKLPLDLSHGVLVRRHDKLLQPRRRRVMGFAVMREETPVLPQAGIVHGTDADEAESQADKDEESSPSNSSPRSRGAHISEPGCQNPWQESTLDQPPAKRAELPIESFSPILQDDPKFSSFRAIVEEEVGKEKRPRLSQARAHYRRFVRNHPDNYAAIVNLGCCHALLGQTQLAVPSFTQAIRVNPEYSAAHMNLVWCYVRLGDEVAATAAIKETFEAATNLTDDLHTQLLRFKRAITKHKVKTTSATPAVVLGHLQPQVATMMRRSSARARASGAADTSISRPSQAAMRGSRIYAGTEARVLEELQSELRSLRTAKDDAGSSTPPWGRLHNYQGEEGDQMVKDPTAGNRWEPLVQHEIAVLRRELGQGSPEFGSREREEGAYRAVEAAHSLPFLQRLRPSKAAALLERAEFLDLDTDEYVFRQGDTIDYMYVIASGTVRVEVISAQFGLYPVTVDSLYDGQLFGEKITSGASDTRRASIVTQEATCLLRFLQTDYRSILGVGEGTADVADDAAADAEVEADAPTPRDSAPSANLDVSTPRPRKLQSQHTVSEELQTRLYGLKRSPFFVGATSHCLSTLATSVPEVELRYGDEFVHLGQVLRGCFLVIDGFCKISAPLDNVHDLSSAAGLPDSCKLAGLIGPDDAEHRTDAMINGRQGCQPKRPAGRGRRPTPPKPKRPSSSISARQPTRPSTARPIFAVQPRCRELSSNSAPRRPGTPRLGAAWESKLRSGDQHCITAAPAPTELDFGWLHPGQAFGLGSLLNAGGECPYKSAVSIRADSCTVRLIMLSRKSLLYLPDTVNSSLMEMLQTAIDPVRPTHEELTKAQRNHRGWVAKRQHVLTREMATMA